MLLFVFFVVCSEMLESEEESDEEEESLEDRGRLEDFWKGLEEVLIFFRLQATSTLHIHR